MTVNEPGTGRAIVKHTPGLWSVFEEATALDYRPCYVNGADGASWVACCMGGGPKRAVDKAEERANARLIAAAPDLLSALQWAATVIRPGTDLHNDMVAAIAKATTPTQADRHE